MEHNRLLEKYDKSNNKYANLKIDKPFETHLQVPKPQVNNYLTNHGLIEEKARHLKQSSSVSGIFRQPTSRGNKISISE